VRLSHQNRDHIEISAACGPQAEKSPSPCVV